MGYFLARSNRTTARLFLRGVFLISGGILLNIGLNANLFYSILIGRLSVDPFPYIFGADILPLAGLSTICIALVRPVFKQSIVAYVLMAVVASSIASLLPTPGPFSTPLATYLFPFFGGNAWWSYFPLFPWLTYPLVGFATRLLFNRVDSRATSRPLSTAVMVLFFVGLILSAEYAGNIASDLPSYYHHGPLFALWTTVFLGGWTMLAFLAGKGFSENNVLSYFTWLGRNVTAAYVFQWLLIGNIATALYRSQEPLHVLMWLLLIVILTTLLVLLWERVRRKFISAPAPSF